MPSVLFVCTGNICRSPSAEGVFRHLVAEADLAQLIATDSCGTHGYHIGDPPDPRAIEAAGRRGVDLSDLRARKLRRDDFAAFDLLIAMDSGHAHQMRSLAPSGAEDRIHLFLDILPGLGVRDVPDPYYSGPAAFEHALDLIEQGSRAWLDRVRRTV